MVTSADCHVPLIEDCRHIMRMDVSECERHHPRAGVQIFRSEELNTRNIAKTVECLRRQRPLVFPHRTHPDSLQVLNRGAKANGIADGRRPRFEPGWYVCPGRASQRHLADHTAAPHEWRHILKEREFAVECPGAHRPEHLVPREGEEVSIERLHVDRHVGNALRAVDDDDGSGVVRHANDLGRRINRAQAIRDVRKRYQSRSLGQKLLQVLEIEGALVRDVHRLKPGILLLGQELPGYEVGVVIHRGHHDEVTSADITPAPGLGDEVDRLSRIADEDDLTGGSRVDEIGHHMAGRFVLRCCALREIIDAAVDVGVGFAVIAINGGDDVLRFLGTGRAI
jgi:hypothetical protein